MLNYQPDAVLAAFVNFKGRTSFTVQELQDYDVELFVINDSFIVSCLRQVGIQNPGRFDKSKVLLIASCAPGRFDQAVATAAMIYKSALDQGGIFD
jgi:hypothetical protein